MDGFKILIADDDAAVRKMIARVLGSEGMTTLEAANGVEAIRMVQENDVDLIILDIMMEGMDGFAVINQLRGLGILTPVFVLSGRAADNDKVLALGIGADDYVTKPFSTTVLCAKVKACMRRIYLSGQKGPNIIELGPFRYLSDEMRLFKGGVDIPLSSKECFMIRYFMVNSGKILTKEQIYVNVWGDNVVDDNTIMVHIRRLRTKIEDDPNDPRYLKTIRGVGYQFIIT